jgi:hypothetical protein
MPRPQAATARAAAAAVPAHAPARRPAAPARRRSGRTAQPARRAPAVVAPRPGLGPALGRFVEAGTAGLLDRLLRGRLWVGFIGVLLAGIVFLNVSLLQLNQDIARTSVHAAALDRQNSALRQRLAALDSIDRIIRVAQARGMIMPPPGEYRYLRAHPWLDAAVAARRPRAASTSAIASASTTSSTSTTTGVTSTPAAAPSTTAGPPATTTGSISATSGSPSATAGAP